MLQHIDNVLAVKELAGHALDLEVLRQFGLVDNEKVDLFLASAFAKSVTSPVSSEPAPEDKRPSKVPRSDRAGLNE